MKELLARIGRETKDYAREKVPEDKTVSGWRMFIIWLAGMVSLPMFLLGIILGNRLTIGQIIIAVFVGQLVVAIAVSITAYIGAKTRLPTAQILKHTFGEKGAYLPALLLGLALLGWFGVQLEVFAISFQGLLANIAQIQFSLLAFIVLGGIIMSTTAIIGFKGLDWLSRITTPLLVLLLAIPTIQILVNGGWTRIINYVPVDAMPLGVAISIVIGTISVGMLTAPDLTRYSKTPLQGVVAVFLVMFIATPIIILFGVVLSIGAGQSSFDQVMFALGWGVPAMIVLILATWTTNDTNLYLSSLSFTSLFKKTKKWKIAIAGGIIGTIVAAVGILGYFQQWLALLGIVFAPAAGIYAIDFFIHRSRYLSESLKEIPKLRYMTFVAWIVGSIGGYLIMSVESGGLGLIPTLSTVPVLDALIIAIVAYLVMHFVKKK